MLVNSILKYKKLNFNRVSRVWARRFPKTVVRPKNVITSRSHTPQSIRLTMLKMSQLSRLLADWGALKGYVDVLDACEFNSVGNMSKIMIVQTL